ncbi:nuclear pore complex protein Nup133 [Centruroides vittatus]|uniref:nuclear pore complex protein Nup133 n=1 Tax=Centruroides vittatus TaxID=120091 RepID=UPI00350F257D
MSSKRSFTTTPLRSTSYKRSYMSGRTPSRTQSANCSFQTSQIIEKTVQHTVEVFGTTLPVLVTEALTVAERGSDVSVKLCDYGWASLVCGRKLFVWKFKQMPETRNMVSHCRELTLPPSDLAHKAELVCVLVSKDSHMPAALAVSPEGIVRYWPNIAHEGSSVEVTAELHGQECFSLTNIQPLGCILATTTNSIILISPFMSDGQNSIHCRTLRIPQGMLAGFSRRVFSFVFGAVPNQSFENKSLIKVLSENGNEDDEKYLYVLAGSTLQKWYLLDHEPDKLLYEYDMDRQIKEYFLDALWSRENFHIHQLKAWSVDMQLSSKGLILLLAGMNPQVSSQLSFAFGILNVSSDTVPTGFTSFYVIKHTEKYTERDEERVLSYKFILPNANSQLAYIYNNHVILSFLVDTATEESDVIEFSSHGDKILGAGTCDGIPLFFSYTHGLMSILSNQSTPPTSAPEPVTSKNILLDLPMKEIEEAELQGGKNNHILLLKRALMLFYKDGVVKSQEIINNLVMQSSVDFSESTSVLDTAVITMSEEFIDDYPASDPRWAESIPDVSSSVSTSLILLHQLEDKIKAHDCFVNFIKSVELWDKLTTVKIRGISMYTTLLLCEHVEKLVAALYLRTLHSRYNEILESAIKSVLIHRKSEVAGNLTYQDVFYCQVSAINEIFPFLIKWEEAQLDRDITASNIFEIITSVNQIFLEVLQEVLQFRHTKADSYKSTKECKNAEYVPWTSAGGPMGLYTMLTKQHGISVEFGIPTADDIQTSGTIFQQLLDLTDIILDGYKCHLESIKTRQEYDLVEQKYISDRRKLILPIFQAGQYERTASLAEKYCDFKILVELCEETDNQDRLNRYMIQFADQGFSDFVFKWYLDEGKHSKLLLQPPSQHNALTQFLKGHDNLSWIHYINTKQYELAHRTLKNLANNEHRYLNKKKTLLSLSKLAALTSNESPDIKDVQLAAINMDQDLILYQETLPQNVIKAFDLDPDRMRVLTPKELLEMYVCDENSGANEYDFKKALDLVSFVISSSNDIESIKLHIWIRAILRDKWEDLDTNNPLESIKDTIFFRTVELAFTQGADLFELLPSIELFLSNEELGCLTENHTFVFLLKAAYEHITRLTE